MERKVFASRHGIKFQVFVSRLEERRKVPKDLFREINKKWEINLVLHVASLLLAWAMKSNLSLTSNAAQFEFLLKATSWKVNITLQTTSTTTHQRAKMKALFSFIVVIARDECNECTFNEIAQKRMKNPLEKRENVFLDEIILWYLKSTVIIIIIIMV